MRAQPRARLLMDVFDQEDTFNFLIASVAQTLADLAQIHFSKTLQKWESLRPMSTPRAQDE